ncbi:Rv3654c family TadE-like protein [Kocuria sp.]|uniref:Rv3654c family TadE-like protein n=1 Tax=Kocuria sp. TaxID=1871328 RepID=UPI0026E10951|nr:Rv3654c family TadE-like protein [Kocuria sp.]MDO5618561.1 flp pilus-assembly TadE/G-like family protein [Kocuria sp.]
MSYRETPGAGSEPARGPLPGLGRGGGPSDADSGAGTVFALSTILVAIFLLGVVLLVGQAAIVKHRAGNVADLSALAAADVARGLMPGDPCDMARRVAESNDAELLECALVEPELTTVDVQVGVDLTGVLAPLGQAKNISRAGPPENSPFSDP